MVFETALKENISLFKGLTDQEKELLAPNLEFFAVSAGELVSEQGDSGGHLLVLLGGQVSVFCFSAKQEKQILKDGNPGDLLGLLPFFDGKSQAVSVSAKTDCSLIRLKKENFDKLVIDHPHLGVKIMRRLLLNICNLMRDMDKSFIGMVRYVVSDR